MKIYKTIINIAAALMLLAACSEAKLDELPFLTAELSVRWADGFPLYEVTIDADERIEIRNIDIYERFRDMNYETGNVMHYRCINNYKPVAPYIFGNKYWPAYGNDWFISYARITTSIGLFHTNTVIITYPTDGIVKVGNGLLKIEEQGFILEIPGDNFDMKATYMVGGEEVTLSRQSTPKLLIIEGYQRKRSSKFDTTLTMNDKEYPLTIDFPVARVASISKTEIEMGDTLSVVLTDCGKNYYYKFNNCDIIRRDLENKKFFLLPKATEEGELDITPTYNNAIESYEKVKINVKKKADDLEE